LRHEIRCMGGYFVDNFAAALMPGTRADCAEGRVDAAFAGLHVATQSLDRRAWGRTR
jgi:hypothetical protein